MPRRNAEIWEHFEKCVGAEKLASCNYCKKILSYKGTTNNLKTHLKLKHLSVYSNLTRASHEISCSRNVESDEGVHGGGDGGRGGDGGCGGGSVDSSSNFGGGSRAVHPVDGSRTTPFQTQNVEPSVPMMAATSSSSQEQPYKIQRMMSSYLPKKLRPADKKIIDKCLIKLIAYDCQPFSIVEDIGFREFVCALNSSYELPSRKTISSSLLPAFYEERKQYFLNYIKENAESVCITVDCWSSRTMDQYMGVTAHFFSHNLQLKSVLLQCNHFDGSHTGVRIAQELRDITDAWGISQKINFLVSDNAANMLRASAILNWNHFGCFEHKLHLIVQDALNTNEDTIDKVNKTISFFKKSSVGKEKLMKYQINNQNIPQPRTLIKAIPTRWNSTFLMLERFYALKEAIQATVATMNISLPIIPIEEWEYIAQICVVLKPFYEVSEVMSGENYLTASTAMVLTTSLLSVCDSLSSRNFYAPVTDLISKLKRGLSERLGDIKNNLNITVCTLLDPRYKDIAFPDPQSVNETKSYVLSLMETLHYESSDGDCAAAESQQNSSDNFSIWGELDSKIRSSHAPKTVETKAKEELDMFLKETVIPRNACPLSWWKTHKCIYPILYIIFKSKCNIMVTSVACERAFSKAGYIVNDRRTRLTTSKVSQIMFLNCNKL